MPQLRSGSLWPASALEQILRDVVQRVSRLERLAPGSQDGSARDLNNINRRQVRLVNAASLNVNTATETAVSFGVGSETAPGHNLWGSAMHSTAVNPSRVTIPRDGYYSLRGQVRFPVDSIGSRSARIYVNGTGGTRAAIQVVPAANAVVTVVECGTDSVLLSAGDYVELYAWHDSATSPLAVPANSDTFFEVVYRSAVDV